MNHKHVKKSCVIHHFGTHLRNWQIMNNLRFYHCISNRHAVRMVPRCRSTWYFTLKRWIALWCFRSLVSDQSVSCKIEERMKSNSNYLDMFTKTNAPTQAPGWEPRPIGAVCPKNFIKVGFWANQVVLICCTIRCNPMPCRNKISKLEIFFQKIKGKLQMTK